MAILITGGAGYIGSQTAKLLAEAGHEIVVLDNLSGGRTERVRWGPLVVADIRDTDAVVKALRDHRVTAVIHLAACAHVGESIANPALYFSTNVAGTISVLDAMMTADVRQMVFASSCSVYGNSSAELATENDPVQPMSPYGQSKLFAEQMLPWYQKAAGIQSICLRYFNAAGADADHDLGEEPEHSLRIVPRTYHAARSDEGPLSVFGTHFGRGDGTAVRDYVHVLDIAKANQHALRYLDQGNSGGIVNIGAGAGVSVRQIVNEVGRALGRPVPVKECEPRAGDPAYVVADATRAHQVLGWTPQHSSLREIVDSAVAWYEKRRQAAP
jgi:UDP-glucose-4-epimerase GalE